VLVLTSLLALVQVAFLPGYLLVRVLRLDESLAKTWVISFALSLVVNHYLVLLLYVAGIGGSLAIWVVFAVELLALAGLLVAGRAGDGRGNRVPGLAADLGRYLEVRGEAGVSPARLLLLVLASACVIELLTYVPAGFVSVFVRGDAMYSYNRWAVDWSAGRFPAFIMNYPQLVPTAWSTVYVMTGSRVQFVPHGMMALFPVSLVLAYVDFGVRRNAPAWLLGSVWMTALMVTAFPQYIGSGLVDIPVAFFAIVFFVVLADADVDGGSAQRSRHLVAAVLVAAGCAMTKQAGLYVACAAPLAVHAIVRRGSDARTAFMAALGAAACLLVLVGPWYATIWMRIGRGDEISMLTTLTNDIHGGRTLLERALHAAASWIRVAGIPLVALLVASIVTSAGVRAARMPLALGLPFFALWTFYFSYDLRNSALSLPFLSLAAGHGSQVAARFAGHRWRASRGATMTVAASACAAALVLFMLFGLGGRMRAADVRQIAAMGNPLLNERLYQYDREVRFDGNILTNYRMLSNLPGLERHVFVNRTAKAADFWPFRGTVEAFARLVTDPSNEIRYVVTQRPLPSPIEHYIDQQLAAERWRLVFEGRGGRFVEMGR